MTCSIPGHDHGESEETVQVWRCDLCLTEFEGDVADPERGADSPRCPQCFLSEAKPIERSEYQDFVIRKTTKFR